jgi:membrane fusion protein (multidrug efflux system)
MSEEQPQADPGTTQKHPIGRELAVIAAALGVGALLLFGAYRFWQYEALYPSTENAYVQANYVWISPQVAGRVERIAVRDDQQVQRGQLLFSIDRRSYAAELQRAQSDYELTVQGLKVDEAVVLAARARIDEQDAQMNAAESRYRDVEKLVARGNAPKLQGIEAKDSYLAARAVLEDAQAELKVAEEKLGPPEIRQARTAKAEAAVELARLNLAWTEVKAPADGIVTRFRLRVGDVVEPGEQLFPFIESAEWWVQANFKESHVYRIGKGMAATVTLDMYPDASFRAEVESISSASAASFSLLPPQNTTGNWVKVTQRLPVRVRILETDSKYPLRMGMSATVKVDTELAL